MYGLSQAAASLLLNLKCKFIISFLPLPLSPFLEKTAGQSEHPHGSFIFLWMKPPKLGFAQGKWYTVLFFGD